MCQTTFVNGRRFKDETGNEYGNWKVLGLDRKRRKQHWRCRCLLCGTVRSVTGSKLRSGRSTGCGCDRMEKAIAAIQAKMTPNLVGQRFGRGRVIRRVHSGVRGGGRLRGGWELKCHHTDGPFPCDGKECECDGTTVYYAITRKLRSGHTRSCGCLARESREKRAERNRLDRAGQKQGLLTVIGREGSKLRVKCDGSPEDGCVGEKLISVKSWNQGVQSCSCLARKAHRKLSINGQLFKKKGSVARDPRSPAAPCHKGGAPKKNAALEAFLQDKLHVRLKRLVPLCRRQFPDDDEITLNRVRAIVSRLRRAQRAAAATA